MLKAPLGSHHRRRLGSQRKNLINCFNAPPCFNKAENTCSLSLCVYVTFLQPFTSRGIEKSFEQLMKDSLEQNLKFLSPTYDPSQ